ncbi:MAG: retropepsin-like aspartic protease [bacterium]
MPHFTLNQGPLGPLIDVFIGVSEPRHAALLKAGAVIPSAIVVKALVDTGASHTAVDPNVMTMLGLQPKRTAQTISPTTGVEPHTCHTYDVSIHVPLGTATTLFSKLAWEVTCLKLKHQGFEMLLGRDILADGLLIYDGKAGTFAMAF